MIRKVALLTVTVLAALTVSATTTSAAIVDNPGMFELGGDRLTMIVHHLGIGEFPQTGCINNWELNVTGDGHVDIHRVAIELPGGYLCTPLDDCDDLGWEGQITSEHSLHIDYCLEGTGGPSDIGGEFTCSVGDGWREVHCASSLVTEAFGLTTLPGTVLEYEGELDLDEALSIEGADTPPPVEVHNPGMFEASGAALDVIVHIPGLGEVVGAGCTNDWEIDVSSDGHLGVHSVAMDPPGTMNCADLDDCDNAGWEGQLTSAVEMHLDFCFEDLGGSGEVGGEVTCAIQDGWTEFHCDNAAVSEQSGEAPPLEVDGELTLDEGLDIEGG